MATETEYKQREPIHHGRNTKRIREMLGIKQDILAEKMKMTQQNISKLEQSEYIADDTLEKLGEALGVSGEFIKNFDEDKAVYWIQSNLIINDHGSAHQNWYPTFIDNPIEKVMEIFEKLLQSEREKVELLNNTNKVLAELNKQIKALQAKQAPAPKASQPVKKKKKG